MQPPEGGGTPPAPLALSVTYRDRSFQLFTSNKEVPLPAGLLAGGGAGATPPAPLYQSSGVRKAVALARYVDALQSWCVPCCLLRACLLPPLPPPHPPARPPSRCLARMPHAPLLLPARAEPAVRAGAAGHVR